MVPVITIFSTALAQDLPPIPQAAEVSQASPAPAPPVLENHGQPMVVPFRCSADDIRYFGMSCTPEEPCPVFLELSSVESQANRIFAAGNIHGDAVTLYSILLASENGGQTWSEAYERLRGTGLDRIQFLDANTGWISGEELFPIPQNAFLLVSNDGGKTWAQRPVLNDAAENRFGSVQQFSFGGKDSGSLILDRSLGRGRGPFVLLESRNGGESWNIQQESDKPLRLRQPPPASSWRVRADARTRAFHLERRQGERWTAVAAFTVKLEPCAPSDAAGPAAAQK